MQAVYFKHSVYAGDFPRCNATGRCIPKSWMCDGEVDCENGQDENPAGGCNTRTACTDQQFECGKGGHCVNRSYYCDGDKDCQDGSDEPDHCYRTCAAGEFHCDNGKCILELHQCDGKNDCGDGSDENNCPSDEYCQGRGNTKKNCLNWAFLGGCFCASNASFDRMRRLVSLR
ncbi:hypothetical protein YQE_10039, partial [Dendroctonus ponderosae]